MRCKYNNSLYIENPPSIIIQPETPKEQQDWMIRTKLDEENYENSYEDIEAVRVRELIKNDGDSYGENEGTKIG